MARRGHPLDLRPQAGDTGRAWQRGPALTSNTKILGTNIVSMFCWFAILPKSEKYESANTIRPSLHQQMLAFSNKWFPWFAFFRFWPSNESAKHGQCFADSKIRWFDALRKFIVLFDVRSFETAAHTPTKCWNFKRGGLGLNFQGTRDSGEWQRSFSFALIRQPLVLQTWNHQVCQKMVVAISQMRNVSLNFSLKIEIS